MDKKHCQLEELRKIAADDYSAHAFASRLESQGLLHAPKNLKESILLQSQSPAVGAEQLLNRTTKKLEFLFYSLKISFAVLSALALLFASSFALNLADSMPAQTAELSWSAKLSQHTDRAGDQLRALTDKLTTMEVFHYDDK